MIQNLMLRQGDVLIVAVPEIPIPESARAVMVPRGPRGVVLQEGTATGHAHSIASRSAELFELVGVRYLRTAESVELEHDEHLPIEIPPGNYRVTIHSEYVPGELPRQVED